MLLHNLQAEFEECLLNADTHGDLLHPEQHMQIYRNNRIASLRRALINAYPLLVKLLGEDFFTVTANAYIEQFPSRQPDLNAYGEYLADFLSRHAPTKQLVYLPEVAAFEWACHQLCFAADHPALAISALQSIPPASYPGLRLTLHPASRLMQFQFPILQLIDLCHNRIDEIKDLDVGGVDLLIIRRDLDIKLVTLKPSEYAFLASVQHEQPLANALSAALILEPGFDLNAKLVQWVKDKTIVRMDP